MSNSIRSQAAKSSPPPPRKERAGERSSFPSHRIAASSPSPPLEERAGERRPFQSSDISKVLEILREVPLIDGHNDLPWQYRKHGNDFDAIDLATDTSGLKMATDIPRLRAGGIGAQFWSVYVPATMPGPDAVKAALEQIDIVHRLVAKYPDTF